MTYTSTIEEINSTRRKFKISVPAASIQDTFENVVSEIQATAEIRGFRKGKAPSSLIRKFYMSDVVKKAADRVVQNAYTHASKDVEFQIISQPKIEAEQQFDENKDFEFTATVDINPKIDMTNYTGIPVKLSKKLQINLDEEVEKQLTNFGGESLDEAKRAEAKTQLTQVLQKMNEDQRVNEAYAQIVEHILAQNSFEAPESLVEDAIDKIISEENHAAHSHHDHDHDHGKECNHEHLNPKDESTRSKYREDATLQVKGVLALGHIARQEGVTVSDQEMVNSLMSFAQMNNMNPKMLIKQVGPQIYNEFRGQVMIQKIMLRLLEQAQIEYVENTEESKEEKEATEELKME